MGTFGVKRVSDEKFCPSTLPTLAYCKNLSTWMVCYEVPKSLSLERGQKHSKNAAPFPPPRQKKKQKSLDLTSAERGESRGIARRRVV